jgi:DNA repair exonuclease SbcCD ATPase subunit
MDEELKQYLDGRFDGVDKRIGERIDGLAQTMASEVGSLQGEIKALCEETRKGFERIDGRLDNQGALIVNGMQALTGLVGYVERMDSNYARLDRELNELRERIAKLERPPGPTQ